MQEIEVKENPLKVKVFINGTPELKNIPKEKAESILAALESEFHNFLKIQRFSITFKAC